MQGLVEIILQLGTSFGSGLYVAISPCLFPLLPLFLMRTLQSEQSRMRSVLVTLVLVLGIIVSLGVYMLIASFIGLILIQNHILIQAVLGAFIVFFGILTMSETLKTKLGITQLSLREHPEQPTGLVSVFMIGLGYSLLAAPCTGPLIVGLTLIFTAQPNPLLVILMFVFVSIGVIIPYLAIALATGEARGKMASAIASSSRKIEIAVGVLLVIVGVILILPFFGINLLF